MSDPVENLENWMGSLSDAAKNIPIINLAIPGTHDSMTYGIDSQSKPAPDAESAVRKVYKFFPLIVRRWAITQKFNTTQQLKTGVRYFDLRVSVKKEGIDEKDELFYVHGLYSIPVYNTFKQIKNYLLQHPTELVILDFQHFYNFTTLNHVHLHMYIINIFGNMLYTQNDGSLIDCTLKNCEAKNKNVIIVYRANYSKIKSFWPAKYWPTPWPATTKISALRKFLNESIRNRKPQYGHVSQCILTPTTKFIILRFFLSLNHVAKNVNHKMIKWIKQQKPGKFDSIGEPKINVVIADFTNIENSNFCKIVVELNKCLE